MNYIVKKYKENDDFKLFVKILLVLLASRLFMLLCVPVYNVVMGTDRSFSFLMNEWDAKKYQYMIDNGYTFPIDKDPQANWAFFPVYVIMCRFVKMLTFGMMDTYYVGMLVSNVCIFVAAFMAVKLIRLIRPGAFKDDGLLIAVLMFIAPYTFYFASTYTEAAFVMFIVLFFYFLAKKRYFTAGLMAALASGTRIVGCTLVFALIVQMYIDMVPGRVSFKGIKTFIVKMFKKPQNIVSVMICPFGTFAYMTFLRFFCGDVWAFQHVQIAWREDYYFPVLGVLFKACTGQIEPRYTYMGWFCVAVFVVYGYMIYRKYYSLAVFGIISLLVPLTSHVMSTCRFTVGSFVIFVGVYDILQRCRPWVRNAVLVVFAVIQTILLFLWYNSDCWLM